ncbi:MAG: hypothetical protein H7Z75_18430 [Ferruginibacter sp.]|nr:hypothetical protein [Cytophagales bacterium]
MKKVMLKSMLCLLAGTLVFTACKKEEEPTEDFVAVDDQSIGLAESDDAVAIVETMMDENAGSSRTEGATGVTANDYCGATITLTPKGNNPSGNIVVDFSTSKPCVDGKTRKGKINIAFTGRYRVPGAVQTITFDGYSVNDTKVEGIKTITHSMAAGVYNTHIKVTGGKLTFKDNSVVEWNSDRTRTWNGQGTPGWEDDEFSVTGTASGKSREGKSYSMQIVAPILLKLSCVQTSGWVPVSGVLEVTPEGQIKRTVDYGNGSCDRTLNVTVGTQSFSWVAK